MTKIRITCRNNADTRNFDRVVRGARHNGGKVMILTIDESREAEVFAKLEAAQEVDSYVYETV